MTPFEMEEQLKDLHTRTAAIEQILPTLATRQDLHDGLAKLTDDVHSVREDVRLTTAALQHEIQSALQEAKDHANRLNERTTEQIRMLAGQLTLHTQQMATHTEQMATKEDLHALHTQQMATKEDLHALRTQQMATTEDLQALRGDIHALSRQIATLSIRRRRT